MWIVSSTEAQVDNGEPTDGTTRQGQAAAACCQHADAESVQLPCTQGQRSAALVDGPGTRSNHFNQNWRGLAWKVSARLAYRLEGMAES